MARLIALLLVVWCAGAQAVQLDGSDTDLTGQLVYAQGTLKTPQEMLDEYRRGKFGGRFDIDQFAANHAPEIWAAVPLSGPADGRVTVDLPLATGAYLYLVQEDDITPILDYLIFRPFDPAQHAGGVLRSGRIQLADGETALLLAHLQIGPLQRLTIAFETPQTTEARIARYAGWQAAFYAFAMASLLIFVTLFAAFEDRASLLFALLFGVGLLFLMYLDGHLFRFLYPGRPEWQSVIGFFLLFATSGAGFFVAAVIYQLERKTRLLAVSAVLAGCALLGFIVSLWSPGTYVSALGTGLLAVMAGMVAHAAGLASRDVPSRVGWALGLVSVVAIGGLVLAQLLGEPSRQLDILMTAKVVFLVLLIAALVGFTAQIIVVRRERAEALAAEMAALAREAEIAQDLLAAEQNYARARDLAQSRKRQLATTSHDLRQPLLSLRMTVDALAERLDPDTRARLGEAFDYIASLSGSYLDAATEHDNAPEADETTEPYPIAMIQQTVGQMFRDEAAAKGLKLHVVPDETHVTVPPLDLMRIVSNLVSNAIKYTTTGEVSLRVEAGPTLVVEDTGPGMTDAELAAFRTEGVKGEASDGHGLGLAVCFDLAGKNGLSLEVASEPGRGTRFALDLIGGSTP